MKYKQEKLTDVEIFTAFDNFFAEMDLLEQEIALLNNISVVPEVGDNLCFEIPLPASDAKDFLRKMGMCFE